MLSLFDELNGKKEKDLLEYKKQSQKTVSRFETQEFKNLVNELRNNPILTELQKEGIKSEMLSYVINLVKGEFNCDDDDVYSYWNDFKSIKNINAGDKD